MLVVPAGLMAEMTGRTATMAATATDTQAAAARARAIGWRSNGGSASSRPIAKREVGYDIESRVPGTGKLRFIEVKGRVTGADTITVTRTRSLPASTSRTTSSSPSWSSSRRLVSRALRVAPFRREPDFGATSVNYDFAELLERGEAPR